MAQLNDAAARMWLASVIEPGDHHVVRLVAAHGASKLCQSPGLLPERVALRLAETPLAETMEKTKQCEARWLTPADPSWPKGLDQLGELAPLGLWVRGVTAVPVAAVSIVGARSTTTYGERAAADLAFGCAVSGRAVVSGGAYGIDAAAHRGALAAAGATVAILAGGVDVPYPRSNAQLFDKIFEQGWLVSESPPGTQPLRHRFLVRNRLIAAWSPATVVVEARVRSGAIATASHAAALGRDVMAVPGSILSASSTGCHALIRDGAILVTSAADIIEMLPEVPTAEPALAPNFAGD